MEILFQIASISIPLVIIGVAIVGFASAAKLVGGSERFARHVLVLLAWQLGAIIFLSINPYRGRSR